MQQYIIKIVIKITATIITTIIIMAFLSNDNKNYGYVAVLSKVTFYASIRV